MLLLTATVGAAAAATARVPVWIPSSVVVPGLPQIADLYYDGMAGRLVRVDSEAVPGLEGRGGVSIEVQAGEVLYLYLVADAARAAFQAPARVLVRAGHEAIVATRGEAPLLTPEAASMLKGLQQPVLVPSTPIRWPAEAPPPPAPPRDADPLIQQMVNDVTLTDLVPAWQTLDDFETRYYNTAQNTAASQWILDQFRSFGLSAEFFNYQQSGQRRDVIATLPGVVDPSQVVYICSHFDATSDTPQTCAPGADDNGSGTAAVIELARVLSRYRFQYTIKFACFNGEEQGMVGSGAYVAYIAGQGENVVCAFDCDMIAYRGTDPAPPDLVIYTNTASQAMATTLANACNTYIPNQVAPLVHVENLQGSDFASFWSYGYKAVCAIEDEAWGDDFCPWYHTCNDRIERYPQDYILSCTKGNLAAVAMTALPVATQGPFLVLGSVGVDDDVNGGSNGNGDGVLNPGETIELWVSIHNVGNATARHVSGVLSTPSADVTILDASAGWNDIPAGGQGTNVTSLRFRLSGSAPDGEALPFTLTMTDDSGSRALPIQLTVVAPALSYYFHRVDDLTYGNGNGVPDPGEVIELPVTLTNRGGQNATNVQAVMTSGDPRVHVINGTSGAALIAAGGRATLSPPFRVSISSDAAGGAVLRLDLAITAGVGYATTTGFNLKVGASFWDDVEADGAWSLSAPDDNATTGLWVRVDPIGTWEGNQPCQPEDDHTPPPGTMCFVTGQGTVGGQPGDQDVDGGKTTLTTPTFDLSHVASPTVAYWRWYTNDLGNYPGEDWWVVQISNDGGSTWVDLERTQQSANSWTQHSFPVAAYVPPTDRVIVRFIASDTGNGSIVEAAVDDFEIDGVMAPVSVDGGAIPRVLGLDAARPSPTAGASWIPFSLPVDEGVVVAVYTIDGRLARTLVDGRLPAGYHQARWDGRLASGVPAPAGVYCCRLTTAGRELSRRIVIVR